MSAAVLPHVSTSRYEQQAGDAMTGLKQGDGEWDAGDSEDDCEEEDVVPATRDEAATAPGAPLGPLAGLLQVADKSCLRCRSRKVKCDRRWPECSRCRKRREKCEFGDGVSLAIQLSTSSTKQAKNGTAPAPTPSRTQASPYARPPVLAVGKVDNARTQPSTAGQRDTGQTLHELWDAYERSNIGERSIDWQLAKPTMASSLTLHLLEASQHSCCFHLPAFHVFSDRVNDLKQRLDSLDVQGSVVVAILSSLGARASPHSALIGVDGPDLDIEKALPTSHEFVLSAGTRREHAWQAIADRALALCSSREILQVPTKQNIEILVALVQMLMLSKVRPVKSRFFLRNVVGMFEDMQREDSQVPLSEVLAIKKSVGRTLYECDARVAAYSSSPLFISDDDVYELFSGTGIVVPDLERDDLGPMLDSILDERNGPIDRTKLDDAIALAGYWVCALQRAYAKISSARRLSTASYLHDVPQLWSWIDRAHAAVQALHRRLFRLQHSGVQITGGHGDEHDIEFDVLIVIRLDQRMLDLLNLAHEFLRRQLVVADQLTLADRNELEMLFALSDKRVRKCLKLSAFFFKVFVDSLDKHMVYHLVVQLQALPSWALMAPQRVGEPTAAGPLVAECELSERELDWLTSALELACFYTPLAHERLQELKVGREARQALSPDEEIFNYTYTPENTTQMLAQAPVMRQPSPPPLPPLTSPLPQPTIYAHHATNMQSAISPSLSPFAFDAYGSPSFRQNAPTCAPENGYYQQQDQTQGHSAQNDGSSWMRGYNGFSAQQSSSSNTYAPLSPLRADTNPMSQWLDASAAQQQYDERLQSQAREREFTGRSWTNDRSQGY